MTNVRALCDKSWKKQKINVILYVLKMKFDWKWDGMVIYRLIPEWNYAIDTIRTDLWHQQLYSLSHYVAFDAIFSLKCIVQKKSSDRWRRRRRRRQHAKNVWADDCKRIRRIFFLHALTHTHTHTRETNIIKNILPVFLCTLCRSIGSRCLAQNWTQLEFE